MIIIGIDPGNVTGMAFYRVGDVCVPATTETPAESVGTELRMYLDQIPAGEEVRVFGERYTITPGIRTAQPAALETMGVVKDVCYSRWRPLEWVQPSTNKRMCDDALLRRMGWYRRTKDGHANDAMRLVVVGLSRVAPEEYSRLTGI